MTISGLDFKNPVGIEMFNCFKRVCIIEDREGHDVFFMFKTK